MFDRILNILEKHAHLIVILLVISAVSLAIFEAIFLESIVSEEAVAILQLATVAIFALSTVGLVTVTPIVTNRIWARNHTSTQDVINEVRQFNKELREQSSH